HTRSSRDWSSDVCSSDLWLLREVEREDGIAIPQRLLVGRSPNEATAVVRGQTGADSDLIVVLALGELIPECRLLAEDDRIDVRRSEERRVGKGWTTAGMQ